MGRVAILLVLSLWGCGEGELDVEQRAVVVDEAPSAFFDDIGEQIAQDVFMSGYVSDDQALMFLRVRLSTEQAGLLWEGNPNPDGTWQWTGELGPGRQIVRLEVEDSAGNLAVEEQEVLVRYNEVPSCDILSPFPGDYALDEPIEFVANSADPDNDELKQFWSSDQDGTLFEGSEYRLRLQRPGVHQITFEAVDPFGAMCRDQVEITVY